MRLLQLAALVAAVALVPGTSSAPVDPLASLAPVQIIADGLGPLRGVAVDRDGVAYVADREAGTVIGVGTDGGRATFADALERPVGLAFDAAGRLLVAEERAGRVTRVEPGGARTVLIANVQQPRWLAVAPDGTLYVSARAAARDGSPEPDDESLDAQVILALTPSGTLTTFASGFVGLQGVAADEDRVYAAARGRAGVATGAAIYAIARGTGGVTTFAALDAATRPSGIALDRLDAPFVATQPLSGADATRLAVVKADGGSPAGTVVSGLAGPAGVAFDAAGNLFVVDGAAGRVLKLSPPSAPAFGALPEYATTSPLAVPVTSEPGAEVFVIAGEDGAATAVADASGAATVSTPLARNATNRLVAWAVGGGGQGLTSAPAEAAVAHDDTAPGVSVESPASGFATGSVAVRAQVADAGSGVGEVTVTANGAPLAVATTPALPGAAVTATATWNAGAAGDGVHTLTVGATDRAGNVMVETRTVTVDTTPPTTSIVAGPDRVGRQDIATFTFTGRDSFTPADRLAFAWRVDDGPWSAYATVTSAAVSGLALGARRFEVRARDLAGNEDPRPAQARFTVVPGGGSSAGTAPGAFALTVAPETAPIIQGGTVALAVTAAGVGARSTVELEVSGLPAGLTTRLSPRRVAPGGTAQLAVRAAADAPEGVHAVTVTARVETDAGVRTATAAATLTVLNGKRTALIGRVVDEDRAPLAGVAIILDALTVHTDANGNFLMLDPPAGEEVILIDGEPISAPGRRYPTIPATVTIVADRVTALPYVPHLHRQHERFTRIDRTRKTEATDREVPGARLHLDADNAIIGWDGRPAEQVSIRTVAADRLPLRPLPAEVGAAKVYMLYFGKRGGGIAQRPVPFEAPNDLGLPPGAKAKLWYYDESPRKGEAPNDWRVAGLGTVSEDGRTIRTDPGVGIPKFCCGATAFSASETDISRKPGPTAELGRTVFRADPVDVSTGIFMLQATDLVVPGRLPMAIRRGYRSGDTNHGPFGVGTSLGDFTEALKVTSATVLTYLYGSAHTDFTLQPNGTYVNTTVPAFRGTVITVNADGSRTLRRKDGRTTTFAPLFSNIGAPRAVSDANGTTVTIARDILTNPISATDAAGRTLTLTWDTWNGVIARVTDPLGRAVQYGYDASRRLTTVTNPAGGVTTYAYDGQARLSTLTDARGITYLTNAYDVNSRVCRQTQADGGVFTLYYVTADLATTQASLDLLAEAAAGGPITPAACGASASNSPVVATVLVDPRGHPETYRFSPAGELTSVTDALGHTTTSTRDPATNLVTAVTDALNRTTSFTYDGNGNVLTVTDPASGVRTFTYTATFNTPLTATDPLGHTTTYTYDAAGNPTSVTDALDQTTTIAYDAQGRPTSVTDPLNHTTTFTYDAAGNLLSAADALGHTTTRAYDAVSRLVSQTNPLGFVTALEYDALNRVTAIRGPKNDLTAFGYDPNGNLLSLTDARANTTSWSYDAMDRVATRTDPLGHSESFTYDPAGNLASHTDRKGQGATFAYDAVSRRTGATYVDATVSYTYDAGGRLTVATDTAGGTITNTYDVLDRLTSQGQPYGTVSYTYDAAGRRATMTVPGQPVTSYAYDVANRLTAITQGTTLVQFAYDAAGRRTSLTLPNTVSTEYGYDVANQLTSLTYKLGTATLGDLQYTYDAAGQRVAIGGTWARTGLPAAVAGAMYDAGNRQVTFGGQGLTYDLNGNLTNDGTNTYVWNARNQLMAIGGPVAASFVYDGSGRRQAKTVGIGTTSYLHDGLNPVQEQSGAMVANLVTGLGIDEFYARTDPGDSQTFLTDALGSTVALTGVAGTVAASYTYEAFGATALSGTTANAYEYTGREHDGTGLKYYRARYYHPQLQRFISADPLGLRGGDPNLYAYVSNRPLSATDPLGLFNILVGAQGSAIGVTGIEGSAGAFVNFGGGSQAPEVGAFAYAGIGTGVDVGYGGLLGFVFGGAGAMAGVTANVTLSVGPISVSSLYNNNGWAGATVGCCMSATPVGASSTVGKTWTWTLSDALDMLLGKQPTYGAGATPTSKSAR